MNSTSVATLDQAKEMGLLPEGDKIKKFLATRNYLELSVYGVMWSEHCSYKNSIVWLKSCRKRPTHAR